MDQGIQVVPWKNEKEFICKFIVYTYPVERSWDVMVSMKGFFNKQLSLFVNENIWYYNLRQITTFISYSSQCIYGWISIIMLYIHSFLLYIYTFIFFVYTLSLLFAYYVSGMSQLWYVSFICCIFIILGKQCSIYFHLHLLHMLS